jgi:hypothetical protein
MSPLLPRPHRGPPLLPAVSVPGSLSGISYRPWMTSATSIEWDSGSGCLACPLTSPVPGPRRQVLLTRGRRVLPHVDHILDTVVDVSLSRFQCGCVRLANDCLKEAPLALINHEVSGGPLLAPEYLALQHRLSIPHYAVAPIGLEMLIMGRIRCGASVWRRCVVRHEPPWRPGAARDALPQGRDRDQQASRWRDSTPSGRRGQ